MHLSGQRITIEIVWPEYKRIAQIWILIPKFGLFLYGNELKNGW